MLAQPTSDSLNFEVIQSGLCTESLGKNLHILTLCVTGDDH